MFLRSISDSHELTVQQLSSFSNNHFSVSSVNDFVLVDISDTAQRIAYAEEQTEYGDSYFTDVNLKGTFRVDGLEVSVSGIVGGIIKNGSEFTVDVVKSVKLPLKYVSEKYWSDWLCPTKCAAYLLMRARKLDTVNIRLICVHTETLEKRRITLTYNREELESIFTSLLSEWSKWTRLYDERMRVRNKQLENVSFPYSDIRDGQDVIMRGVSSAIDENRPAFINAPTGIGKTSAVLYPALKSLARGKAERIFYLTSKNSLHSVVIDTCRQMEKNGCKVRVLSLVSRNKLCPSGKCNRKECQRLSGHSDRLKMALYELLTKETYFTYDILKRYAENHSVCPFELARHSAQFSDVVICDYNYIFDPDVSRVNLFTSKGSDVLLVDEAHNLVERLKEMHSAVLFVDKISEISSFFKNKNTEFFSACEKFINSVEEIHSDDLFQAEPLDRNSIDNILITSNIFFEAFQSLVGAREFADYFSESSDVSLDTVNKLFATVKKFISLFEVINDNYIVFFDEKGNVRILLVDTGATVRKVCKKMGHGIFFSATLSPEEYYRHMLGAAKKDVYINLTSPFPIENFKIVSYALSTRYSERGVTLPEVVDVIYNTVLAKAGNYMVFAPSYSYLSALCAEFSKTHPEIDVIIEKSGMNSNDKDLFVKRFENASDKTMVAFAVMGGNFSEGIDLSGDRLLGAIIVGLGVLPPERSRELTAGYFNDRFFDGVKFAYVYPGMNKVFQAGGRVIRSESDKGVLVVVDDRFLTEDYIENLPEFWRNISKSSTTFDVGNIIRNFWKNN